MDEIQLNQSKTAMALFLLKRGSIVNVAIEPVGHCVFRADTQAEDTGKRKAGSVCIHVYK